MTQWNPNQPPPPYGQYPGQATAPQQQQYPQQYQQYQQPGYGPPLGYGQPQAQGSIQDLQGLNEADPESKFPPLPPHVQTLVRCESFKLKPTMYGLKQFTDITLLSANNPALVGQTMSTKIGGFASIKGKKYSLADLKSLLIALYHSKGLTAAVQTDWIQLAWQTSQDDSPVVGVQFVVQSSEHLLKEPKDGKTHMTRYTYQPYTG